MDQWFITGILLKCNMDEIIQIKCPFDGAVLSVRNQPGIETRNVTCPICKQRYPFTKFRRITKPDTENDPPTEYPDTEATSLDEETTITKLQETDTPVGILRLLGTRTVFKLHEGRNVVGRKAANSKADFQIDTGAKRGMSRSHLVIEVKMVEGRGAVHFISLAQEKVNKTLVADRILVYPDSMELNHCDILRLPDASLRFEIPGLPIEEKKGGGYEI